MQSVVASPSDAIFSLAGVSGLPTIAPVLGLAGLQTYTLNSLFIAPLGGRQHDRDLHALQWCACLDA